MRAPISLIPTDLRRLLADKSGNMTILFSLSAPIAIGLAALGTEGGQLYLKKTAAQAAADLAAISAANSLNSAAGAYTIEGKGVAAAMGFVDGQNGVSITVNKPPTSGLNAGKTSAVEVIISKTQAPLLSALVHPSSYVIEGRAVAIYGGGPGCVMALNPTASAAINIGGNTTVSMPNCNLVSNSSASDSISVSGSASATVNGAIAVGGISATAGLVDNFNQTGAASISNPYGSMSVPAKSSWGSKQSQSNAATVTYQPGWYNNGLTINAGQVVTLSPGVYFIDGAGGNLNFSGGSVTGTGVTIVLTSSTGKPNSYASVSINGNASLNIKAPTSDSAVLGSGSAGVVMYDDPNATANLTINGNSNTYFGGAIVAPSATVKFAGTGVSGNGNNCTQIVANEVNFTGNSTIGSSCTGTGVSSFGNGGKTRLAE